MGVVTGSMRVGLVLAAFVLLGISGCSKLKDAAEKMQPGKAYLDSQIPPGLSPQYFPPQGFVWGAYRADSLPEARYGVASPPINPNAQVLILADADYPAETYFELTHQLLDAGYGVWLLEAPGQGGSGHYLMQGNTIYIANYHDAQASTVGFIKNIIHPTMDKPLFVLGTGYSAVNALSLSTLVKDEGVAGFVAYAPYSGGAIESGKAWHRDEVPQGYWAALAQNWQGSNPDLRLRIKSEAWIKQMQTAYSDLNGLHLPVISLKNFGAQVLVINDKNGTTDSDNKSSSLCAHLPRCQVHMITGPQSLGNELTTFMKLQLRSAG